MSPLLPMVTQLALHYAVGRAAAAEPGATAAPAADAIPLALSLEPVPFAQTRVWEEVAQPGGSSALVSLSVSRELPGRWLAADEYGAVFLTDDRGGRWTRMLAGGAPDVTSDEQLLLEAEALSEDSFEGVEAADVDAESAAVDRANETTSQALEEERNGAPPLPPAVWFDRAGIAFASRQDEVWRSTDDGETWSRVDGDGGATAFARVGETLVAGGSNGIRASLDDGASWLDVDGAVDGHTVREISVFAGKFHAATDGGLFESPDALRWTRVLSAPDMPLVSVIADPNYPEGYWLVAERGLYRTDDSGQSFSRFGNQPLKGLRKMVHVGDTGHLLAISADGVWESMDGGVKWTPASRLLSDPDVRALDFEGGEPVIATAKGVWRMIRPEQLAETTPAVRASMPLALTVQTALSRSGMDGDMLSLAQRSGLLPLIPALTVQAKYGWQAGRAADFQVLSAAGTRDTAFSATAALCWGACSASSSYYSYDSESYDVQQMVDDGQLTVIDGNVYDSTAVVAAAANVSQSLSTYRVSTAQQISEAWITRARLLDEPLAGSGTRDQVMHALAVQEIDARLDAWTNGRFSTWQPESP